MPTKCQRCDVNRALFAAAIGGDRKQVCSSRCLKQLIGADVKFIGDDIFDTLPDEKLIEIFQHADTEDLASLRQTSRRFRNVAGDRQTLVHHFSKTISTEPIEAGTLALRWIKANDHYRLGIALEANMPVEAMTLRSLKNNPLLCVFVASVY